MLQRFEQQLALGLLLLSGICVGPVFAQDEAALPETYIVDYPQAERFCAPIRSTFIEVTRTFGVVRGKRFRQKPNGGYGLAVADQVDGQHLRHVGADLGWYQVGEPVFAIANGVVRVSTGPKLDVDEADDRQQRDESAGLAWGNFVAIEHRLGDDQYVTSLYGHLGSDRRVQVGDIVAAGQQIGTIGREHPRINGGYKPHLHFGVRAGRNAEPGAVLLQMQVNGQPCELKLVAVDAEWSEVQFSQDVPLPLNIRMHGNNFSVEHREGKQVIRSTLLWQLQRADFPLVGYALTTDDWADPIRFLRHYRADSAPAEYFSR